MFRRCILYVALCWLGNQLGPAGILAQTIRTVTVDQALHLMHDNNLRLRLSRLEADAAMGDSRQLRAFPNPTGQFIHEQLSDAGVGYSETYFNVRMPLVVPWVLSARSGLSTAVRDGAMARVRADSNQVQFEVKRTMIEAIVADRRVEIATQVLQLFRSVHDAATARFNEGDISGYDLRRIQLELARYEQVTARATTDLDRVLWSLTRSLLPNANDTILVPVDFLDTDLPVVLEEDLFGLAMSNRAEILVRQAEVTSAEASRREVSSGRWLSEFVVTGGYKRQSDGFDGPFVAAEIPLPILNRQGGSMAASAARVAAAESRAILTESVIRDDVRGTARKYESTRDRWTNTVGPLYQATQDFLAIARASYEEGEMELIGLLDAADAYFESRAARIDLLAEWWVRYFDLERAVGGFSAESPSPGGAQ